MFRASRSRRSAGSWAYRGKWCGRFCAPMRRSSNTNGPVNLSRSSAPGAISSMECCSPMLPSSAENKTDKHNSRKVARETFKFQPVPHTAPASTAGFRPPCRKDYRLGMQTHPGSPTDAKSKPKRAPTANQCGNRKKRKQS